MASRLGKPLMYALCTIVLSNIFFVGNLSAKSIPTEISKTSKKASKAQKTAARKAAKQAAKIRKASERVAKQAAKKAAREVAKARKAEARAAKQAAKIQARIARQIAKDTAKALRASERAAAKALKNVVKTSIVVAEIAPEPVVEVAAIIPEPTIDARSLDSISQKNVADAVNAGLFGHNANDFVQPYSNNGAQAYSLLHEVIDNVKFIKDHLKGRSDIVMDIFGQDGGGYIYASVSPAAGGNGYNDSGADMVRMDWANMASGMKQTEKGEIELVQ